MEALTFNQSQSLIHFACRKWVKSFESSGSGLEYDDLVQEASIVYLKTAEQFKPELNLAFSTYLVTSINHRFSALLEKNARFNHMSLSTEVESMTLEESLQDTAENPELECEASALSKAKNEIRTMEVEHG